MLFYNFIFSQANHLDSILFEGTVNSSSSFGASISYQDTLIAIGAPQENTYTGSIYIFKNKGKNYSQISKIVASDGANYSSFGNSVSLNKNMILVGSLTKDNFKGEAYFYRYRNNQWEEEILQPANLDAYDRYGYSVSLSDSFGVISAPYDDDANTNAGKVYIYKYDKSKDSLIFQEAIVTPDKEASQYFGTSVIITDKRLYVGSEGFDNTGTDIGRVYIYKYDGTSWVLEAKLDPDLVNSSQFGHSLALKDSTLFVGANLEPNSIGSQGGDIYIFQKSSNQWDRTNKLIPATGSSKEKFGSSMYIHGDTLAISAPNYEENSNAIGAVYVYLDSSSTWVQRAFLKSKTPKDGDNFGASVCIIKDNILVGAPGDDSAATDAGALYNFLPAPHIWQQPTQLLNECSGNVKDLTITGFNIDSVRWQKSNNGIYFLNLKDDSFYINTDKKTMSIIVSPLFDSTYNRCMLYNKYYQLASEKSFLTLEKNPPIPNKIPLDTVFGQCSVSITTNPTATDECDANVIASTDSALSYNTQGIYKIVWKYTDPNNNSSFQTQVVVVDDTTKPKISLNTDTIFVMASSDGFYHVTTKILDPISYSDNCSGNITLSNNFNSKSTLEGESIAAPDTIKIIWTADDNHGNVSIDSEIVVVSDYVQNIEELNAGIIIYPNPARNYLFIKTEKKLNLKIFNNIGQCLINKRLVKKLNQIDISNLPSGNYIIQFYNKKSFISKNLNIIK